jgi:hypothetical protein
MKPSIIIWDLETVPDLAGFAAGVKLRKERKPGEPMRYYGVFKSRART